MNADKKHQKQSHRSVRIRPALDRFPPLFVGSLIVLAVAGAVVANLLAPLLSFTFPRPDGSHVAAWADLRNPTSIAYEQSLLILPLVAYALVVVFGGFMILRGRATGPLAEKLAHWKFPATILLGYAGFILTLTGMRWLGFYIVHLMQDGQSLTHLHVVPYLNLVFGALLLAGSIRSIFLNHQRTVIGRPHHKWAFRIIGTAMAGLLLMPLLPFAWAAYTGVTIPLGEFNLALTTTQASMWDFGAGHSLAITRLMVWVTMGVSTLAVMMSYADERWGLPARLHWTLWADRVNILFILLGVAATIRFYEQLPHVASDIRFGVNPFLVLAFITLAALWWIQGRQPRRMPRL